MSTFRLNKLLKHDVLFNAIISTCNLSSFLIVIYSVKMLITQPCILVNKPYFYRSFFVTQGAIIFCTNFVYDINAVVDNGKLRISFDATSRDFNLINSIHCYGIELRETLRCACV